jgi:hypothetical protein
VDLILGRISVHRVGLASAHESPLKTAIEVATWLEAVAKVDTTSFSGEYSEGFKEKLNATPGYDKTYIPLS